MTTTSRKPNENDRTRGSELALLRKKADLTQEQVAIRLGISAKQYGKYERGQTRLSASRYEEVLRIVRRPQHPGAGFEESQASFDGPRPTREVFMLMLRRLFEDMKRCIEMFEKL